MCFTFCYHDHVLVTEKHANKCLPMTFHSCSLMMLHPRKRLLY
jgi:hypothetical protein